MRASWLAGITVLGWLLVGCSQPASSAAEIPLVERLDVLSGAERHTSRSGDSSLTRYNIRGKGVESTTQAILSELRAFGFEWVRSETRKSGLVILAPRTTQQSGGPTMISIGPGFVSGANGERREPEADGCHVYFSYIR